MRSQQLDGYTVNIEQILPKIVNSVVQHRGNYIAYRDYTSNTLNLH